LGDDKILSIDEGDPMDHHVSVLRSRISRNLFILALLAPVFLGGCQSAPDSQKVGLLISPQDAQTELSQGAFLLDVREVSEFQQVHISGATLIPLGQLASHFADLPKDRLILVICRTGVRSAQGRDLLLANGFTLVSSVSGGMQAWVAAGLPVAAP
jgi:rhodanese-related sulfurtransferase